MTKNISERWQDSIILDYVKQHSKVLDLGCGSGKLLYKLVSEKSVFAQGVEIDIQKVYSCMKKGVRVLSLNLEDGLYFYADKTFDYVILEETLQTLKNPIDALNEMLRIGKSCIVTFPNFGYKGVYTFLDKKGKMPKSDFLPYNWYDTPNIHLCTLKDMLDWIKENNLTLEKGFTYIDGKICSLSKKSAKEAEEVLLVISRA